MAKSSVPKPTPLVRSTRKRIIGRLAGMSEGDCCPAEAALALECGVSRTTVRAALRVLEAEGLLTPGRRGWRLASSPPKAEPVPTEAHLPPKEQMAEAYLSAQLATGRLRPGEYLAESTVARELGFSNAPVREAFFSLASLGLFEKENRRRWRVTRLDCEKILELMDVRRLVEGYGLDCFFQSDHRQKSLVPLRRQKDATQRLLSRRTLDVSAFYRQDIAFHQWILRCTDNRYLMERHGFVYLLIELQLRNPGFDEELVRLGLREHEEIMLAIEDGDCGAAKSRLMGHLETASETLLRLCVET